MKRLLSLLVLMLLMTSAVSATNVASIDSLDCPDLGIVVMKDGVAVTGSSIALCPDESDSVVLEFHAYRDGIEADSLMMVEFWLDGIRLLYGQGVDRVSLALTPGVNHNVVIDYSDTTGCYYEREMGVYFRERVDLSSIVPTDTVAAGSALLLNPSFMTLHVGETSNSVLIPDGPNCGNSLCLDYPIVMSGFPDGATLTNAADIRSICMRMEHSFMGDISLSIICPSSLAHPSGQTAMLKYKTQSETSVEGAGGGGGRFLGIPMGGLNHNGYDGIDGCDPIDNPAGEGWNYCFSRHADYTLIGSGLPANATLTGNHYLANGPLDTVYSGSLYYTTADSSDHANRSDYYLPADDLSQLVGCPLNGTWKIRVCDSWAGDNGWAFDASLEIGDTLGAPLTFEPLDPSALVVGTTADGLYAATARYGGTHGIIAHVTLVGGCTYDDTIYAVFEELPGYTIGVASNIDDVALGSAWFTDTLTAEHHSTGTYYAGTEVTLWAENDDFRFVGWSDGVTENPRTLALKQDTLIEAVFVTDEGIEEMAKEGLVRVYPNPVKGLLHVSMEGLGASTLTLYDTKGVVMKRMTAADVAVMDLGPMAKGVYVLQVATEEQTYSRRIVVE